MTKDTLTERVEKLEAVIEARHGIDLANYRQDGSLIEPEDREDDGPNAAA